jgi:hypothetical protein
MNSLPTRTLLRARPIRQTSVEDEARFQEPFEDELTGSTGRRQESRTARLRSAAEFVTLGPRAG